MEYQQEFHTFLFSVSALMLFLECFDKGNGSSFPAEVPKETLNQSFAAAGESELP